MKTGLKHIQTIFSEVIYLSGVVYVTASQQVRTQWIFLTESLEVLKCVSFVVVQN